MTANRGVAVLVLSVLAMVLGALLIAMEIKNNAVDQDQLDRIEQHTLRAERMCERVLKNLEEWYIPRAYPALCKDDEQGLLREIKCNQLENAK